MLPFPQRDNTKNGLWFNSCPVLSQKYAYHFNHPVWLIFHLSDQCCWTNPAHIYLLVLLFFSATVSTHIHWLMIIGYQWSIGVVCCYYCRFKNKHRPAMNIIYHPVVFAGVAAFLYIVCWYVCTTNQAWLNSMNEHDHHWVSLSKQSCAAIAVGCSNPPTNQHRCTLHACFYLPSSSFPRVLQRFSTQHPHQPHHPPN